MATRDTRHVIPLTHAATLKKTTFTFVFQSRKRLREVKGPVQVTPATLPAGAAPAPGRG